MALDPQLASKLDALEQRSEDLSRTLSEPDIMSDMERYKNVSRTYAELQPILDAFRRHRKAELDLAGARELQESADDAEMKKMASDEIRSLDKPWHQTPAPPSARSTMPWPSAISHSCCCRHR